MHSKWNIDQKNVKLILLIHSRDAHSIKICHTCSIEKYGYIFLVHLIAFSCKIARAKKNK
jgi:hypothetical protein